MLNKLLFLALIIALLFIGIKLRGKSSDKIAQTKSIPASIQPQQNKSASQENEGGNVTVIITPKNLKVGDNPEFEVKFETHSVELNFDVSQVSKLYDDKGNILTMPSWEGNPPGGHHRKGILTFSSPLGEIEYVELTMLNIAGIKERKFKWRL